MPARGTSSKPCRRRAPNGPPLGTVAGQRRPTQDDRAEVVRSVLADLSWSREPDPIIERLVDVRPKNDTGPAEDLFELAAAPSRSRV